MFVFDILMKASLCHYEKSETLAGLLDKTCKGLNTEMSKKHESESRAIPRKRKAKFLRREQKSEKRMEASSY